MKGDVLAPTQEKLNVTHDIRYTPLYSENETSSFVSLACSRVVIIFKCDGMYRDEMYDLNLSQ